MFHIDILDAKRRSLLPLIARAGKGFYLAGGTALALQIGHRDSIDFDFFAPREVDTTQLWQNLEEVFVGHTLQKTQEEKNTLSIVIDNEVRLSFFGYHYPLLNQVTDMDNIDLASILDIGCMKLSAITGRSTLKDYVDLYAILQQLPLAALLVGCRQKFPTLDEALVLKSLTYTDDIEPEPIRFMPGYEVTIETIVDFHIKLIKDYLIIN